MPTFINLENPIIEIEFQRAKQEFFTNRSKSIAQELNKVQELIKKGANVNIGRDTSKIYYRDTEDTGKTPLMYAAGLGDLNIVKLLLKHGANINMKNKKNMTAIMFAIKNSKRDVVFYLYDKIKNKRDSKLLAYAVRVGDYQITEFLLKHKVKMNYETFKDTILTLAIKGGNVKIVKKILDINESLINKPTQNKEYPIMFAVSSPKDDILNELLRHKNLNLSVRNSINQTILHIAALKFSGDEVIKKLIDAGVNPNIRDNNGKTALFYILRGRADSTVKYLIDKTDLSIKDNQNKTVFFYTVSNYNTFSLLFMKNNNIDITQRDKYDKSLLLYIIDRGDYRVLKLFEKKLKVLKNEFNDENLISVAVRRGSYDMVKILLDAGFNVNGVKGKVPPLLKAAELNKVMIFYLLLFYKADKNVYFRGETVWSIAEKFKYLRILFILRNFKFEI